MKRFVCTLIVLLITTPVFLVVTPQIINDSSSFNQNRVVDFDVLANTFGDTIPIVASFDNMQESTIEFLISKFGLEFSLGSAQSSRVGSFYLIQGSAAALDDLAQFSDVDIIGPQTLASHTYAARDVSMPEINATLVWQTLDDLGRNVTGEGILIADLDSGVDWTHPDLWYANGSSYNWIDQNTDTFVTNGTDYIDLDDSGTGVPSEALYYIDLDGSGTFNSTTEWIWVDNGTQNGVPNIGEPFFVVNDTNNDDALNVGESLIMLNKPKTRYIVEKIASNLQVWDRNTNLTSSTHEDTDGHGTAVSGILLGGQVGYRKYVGAAPNAELMMIKVLGPSASTLTIEEGLTYAYNQGAEVILIEIGSWTYEFLDGSSAAEVLIDSIVASGIPVIAPSGNLGGKDKHALFTAAIDTPYTVDFSIPPVGGPPTEGEYIDFDIEEVYITVLSVNTTDFAACNFSVIMNMGGPLVTIYLHPGTGMWNWVFEPIVFGGGFSVRADSFIESSSRSTSMLAIRLTGTLPITTTPPWHSINVTAPQETVFHAYISDDQSSWTGGCIWKTDVSDDYEITWPSTSDSALSVASYRTRDILQSSWGPSDTLHDLAGFSSRGPRIDGTLKQGVAAPGGYDVISIYSNASLWADWYNAFGAYPFNESFGSYQFFSGTSASGPHVAGTAALMLQTNSSCGSEVANIIKLSAVSDSFTGNVPNPNWGWGKLDAYAAVQQVTPVPDTSPPTIGIPFTTPATPVNSTPTTIEVSVSDFSGVDTVILGYFNGSTWVNISMSLVGSYYSAEIPLLPTGTNVIYRIYANDSLGNNATSPDYSFTIQSSTATTTTSTTATTTTTTTTNTTGSSTDSTPTGGEGEPDYLTLALMLGIVLAVLILGCIASRRRERYQ